MNSKHLLSAGKVTTEDKTAEIVSTLASIAVQAATLAKGKVPEENRQPFFFSFDPSDDQDVCFVRRQLALRGVGLSMSRSAKGRILPSDDVKGIAPGVYERGLVFRPAAVYNITITYPRNHKRGELVGIRDTEQFILPIERSYA